MGMFDHIRCEYPEVVKDCPVDGWQSKDTPSQFLDEYIIDEAGALWAQRYDVVDKSDPTATGFKRLYGAATRENTHLEHLDDFIGEIRFYQELDGEWFEYSAYFEAGRIVRLNRIPPPKAFTSNEGAS